MGNLIGDEKINEETLQQMRSVGGNWFIFQNHDLGHPDIGDLRFLKVGEDCTFKEPPKQYPDTKHGIGWRYRLVGKVDLATGKIIEEK